jgi:radical SAM superfamily enzyme YgiQ (UPF0313 family)
MRISAIICDEKVWLARLQKLQFVHPPNDARYRGLRTGYSSFPPPTGLEILAACAQTRFPDLRVQIFDGNTQSLREISASLNADVVGISDWFTSHQNALRFARVAKQRNPSSMVILGGPNASNLARRILRRHSEVDFIVYGDGEDAIVRLLARDAPSTIPNLWYRSIQGEILFTGQTCASLDSLPLFDFRHLMKPDLAKYSQSVNRPADLGLTPVPISSLRGCLKSEKQGPCTYCSIVGRKLRMMNPERAWEQIVHLHDLYGIDYFFETGNSFAVGDFPERFLKARPPGLRVRFRNYANPDSLNSDNIRVFKELGVEEVFIGVESTDASLLKQANKIYNIDLVERTVAELQDNGIRVFMPFLFGLPGETTASVRKTSDFAQYLVNRYRNIQRVLFSLAIPLVGTTWFTRLLRDPDVVREYDENGAQSLREDDTIDYERLFLLSLKRHCSTSFAYIYRVINRAISGLPADRVAGFGCLEDGVAKLEARISA